MFLAIRNPGVADNNSFTILGASGTRNSGRSGTIGQFGTGSKFSVSLLLRNNIRPVICCGNLKMEFFTKPIIQDGQTFRQVCVKYSGKDIDGNTNNKTVELGYVAEMGVKDWKTTDMALREFVANAIDGSIKNGGSHKDVFIDIVNEPRAKAGHTIVFLPYESAIEESYSKLSDMFLHIDREDLLSKTFLPKSSPGKTFIYKDGVRVHESNQDSVYDYNFRSELNLNESRVCDKWQVQACINNAIKHADVNTLANIIKRTVNDTKLMESEAADYIVSLDHIYGDKEKEEAKKRFGEAFRQVAGDAVMTSGMASIDSFIQGKGLKTFPVINNNWYTILKSFGISTEFDILTEDESKGKIVNDATNAHHAAVAWVWKLLESFKLTDGKTAPKVMGFNAVMDGGAQCYGYFKKGGDTVYLHNDLDGRILKKVALEECVHYLTGSDDFSRDLQDFLFKLVVEIAD